VQSFLEELRETSKFFMKTDEVHDTLARVTRRLSLDLAEKLDPSVRETYIEYWRVHQNATGPDRE
jgi:hypothetical protein